MKLLFALLFATLLTLKANAQSDISAESLARDITRLSQALSDLQASIEIELKTKTNQDKRDDEQWSVFLQSLQDRLASFESGLEDVTGKVELIQHQMVELQIRLERLNNDTQFRLQRIEDWQASLDSDQKDTGASSLIPSLNSTSSNDTSSNDTSSNHTNTNNTSTNNTSTNNNTTTSLEKTTEQTNSPSSPPPTTSAVTHATPQEHYAFAFELVRNRQFQQARQSFNDFLNTYPNHELASNALYWKGETYYTEKLYADAAALFLELRERYPNADKTPDAMLKLGLSLLSLNDSETACRVFQTITQDYTNAPNRLLTRTQAEIEKNNCNNN